MRPEGIDFELASVARDVSMRNSRGMPAGTVSRSMQRSSSNRRSLSAPRLTCTMLMTGLRLFRLWSGCWHFALQVTAASADQERFVDAEKFPRELHETVRGLRELHAHLPGSSAGPSCSSRWRAMSAASRSPTSLRMSPGSGRQPTSIAGAEGPHKNSPQDPDRQQS